ncbi:MAG: EamA family transporter [Anaerolineales bacterium]|nr:MAG: EamA family transporter [Anaerolineales bacterium]
MDWVFLKGALNTGFAYALWFHVIKKLPTTGLPMLGLLSPSVALFLGFFILNLRLWLLQSIGIALILGSVVLSQVISQLTQHPLTEQ